MCYQIVERYALCGCIYHVHPIDPCGRASQRGHAVTIRESFIDYGCSRHPDTESPGIQARVVTSQQDNVIKHPQADLPKKPHFSWRTEIGVEPSVIFCSASNGTEDQSLQTAIAAYATRETSIHRTLEAIVAPSTGKHATHDDDYSSAPSSSSSLFDGTSASSKSTVERPPDFVEELLSAFVNNVTLVPLFRLALKCDSNKFIKTFTALLRLYSKDLGHVSSSPLEKNASMIIRARSRYIASHLEDYFTGCHPQEALPETRISRVAPHAQDDDASDGGDNHDAFEIPHLLRLKLVQVKKFLFDDVPFLKLRQRLEKLAGEASNPSDATSDTPDQSTSKYRDTPKRTDNLKASQISVMESKGVRGTGPPRKMSLEQKTVAIEQNGEQTERPGTPVIADGSSSVPKTLRPIHRKSPYSEGNLSPNDVPEGKSARLTVRSNQEESLNASKISVLTDDNLGQEIVRTAVSHETASSVFIQTVVLVVLIKRLGRRKIDIRVAPRDPSLAPSQLSAAREGSLVSSCSKDRFSTNCHQSSWSQLARDESRYTTKGALHNESAPLLSGDWRVQEVSWDCVSILTYTR